VALAAAESSSSRASVEPARQAGWHLGPAWLGRRVRIRCTYPNAIYEDRSELILDVGRHEVGLVEEREQLLFQFVQERPVLPFVPFCGPIERQVLDLSADLSVFFAQSGPRVRLPRCGAVVRRDECRA
jgi:hypothetical protein